MCVYISQNLTILVFIPPYVFFKNDTYIISIYSCTELNLVPYALLCNDIKGIELN